MKKILRYMGVDRAVAYTLASRGWGLLSGLITLLLVARNLTSAEQGYYYTFASLLAMQILFELGMSVVVMQFSSHEMAHLSWSEKGILNGEANSLSRLRSLVMLVSKWYGIIAILIIVIVTPVGWIMFSNSHSDIGVSWHLPWLCLICAAATNIFFMPFLALLEGCGRVTEVARLRMIQNIIGSLLAWGVLISGGGLWAMPVMNIGFGITVIVWLWKTKKLFFMNLLEVNVLQEKVNWKTEIWPFQWRIALSWLSGFFIFQLFTPVLFAYRGAVEAGQMGMSISISNALMGIAIAWMNTKAPGFGALVATKDYLSLDKIFAVTLTRSLAVIVIVGGVLCILNYIIHAELMKISYRILDPLPFMLLILATIFTYITYAQATYLRAHKEEPFMLISLISAILIGSLTIILGKEYGSLGLMAVYATIYCLVGVGWGSLIFFSKRRNWQKQCGYKVASKGML
jgi:O-antigen/teichoic acid export membrane protein